MNRTMTLTPLAATHTRAARRVAATATPPPQRPGVRRPAGSPPGGLALATSADAIPASTPLPDWARTLVVGGLGFLLARPARWAVPGGTAVLAGGYLVLPAAAPAAAGRARPGPVAWPAMLAVGVAAVPGAEEWALFHHVLPAACSLRPGDVAAAARAVHLPRGGLPNGSGLAFGRPGTIDAGANLQAASVVWQWAGVNRRAVVWPPPFATAPLKPLRPTR